MSGVQYNMCEFFAVKTSKLYFYNNFENTVLLIIVPVLYTEKCEHIPVSNWNFVP